MRVPKSARTKCQIFIGTPTKEEEPYRPGAQGISIRVETENCQLQIQYAAKVSFTHRASMKVFQATTDRLHHHQVIFTSDALE